MVLVHDDRSFPLHASPRDSSSFERDFLGNLGDPDHLDAILVSEDLERVRLDLKDEAEGLVVLEEDQVTRTVQLCNGLTRSLLSSR